MIKNEDKLTKYIIFKIKLYNILIYKKLGGD